MLDSVPDSDPVLIQHPQSMHELIESKKFDFENAIQHCKDDLGQLRTGRATPALVEDVVVEAYGAKQALKALATITTPDFKTISIEPWDKTILVDIEKGIRDSSIGVEPMNDGRVVRVNIPQMTEESRKDMIKILGQKLEQCRITVRQLRDKARDEIQKAEKAKEIGEDDKFRLQKDLDEMVGEYNERIKKIGDEKEKEIMIV